MKLKLEKLVLFLVVCLTFKFSVCVNDLDGCNVNDGVTADCKSIPKCSDSPSNLFKKITKFDFHETINVVNSRSFSNCSFISENVVLMTLYSINEIKSNAFTNMKIGKNVKLNIEIIGNDKLVIRKNAFSNLILSEYSHLIIKIFNYMQLTVEDSIDGVIVKGENSVVEIILENIDEVKFIKSSKDSNNYQEKNSNFKKNVTTSIEISNSQRLVLDSDAFRNMMINPYSSYSITIQQTDSIYLADNLFDGLMMSIYSKFTFYIDKSNGVLIGKNIFKNLLQEEGTTFIFIIENVNPLTSSTEQVWICLPENFLNNAQQDKNSIIQVHFLKISASVNIATNAFNEIRMKDKSKIQILFNRISGHIIFNTESVTKIEAIQSYFEIWVEDHALTNSVSNGKVYFKISENALTKFYQTTSSTLRIGFQNSKSLLVVTPGSFSGLKQDHFDDEGSQSSFSTKVIFDIKNSEKFYFDLNLDSLPQLIEINSYEPLLSTVKPDGTLDTGNLYLSSIRKINSNVSGLKNMIEREFCQFSKLNKYLTKKNFFFFNEIFNIVPNSGPSSASSQSKTMCSSCLFLFLYRFVHKREDFFSLKDYLPECYLQLIYPVLNFQNEKNNKVKLAEINEIEARMERYWRLQKCVVMTGMDSVFEEYDNEYIQENICERFFTDDDLNNKKFANTNLIDTCIKLSNNTNFVVKTRTSVNSKKAATASFSLIVISSIGVICLMITALVIHKKYKGYPCFRINFKRGFKKFKFGTKKFIPTLEQYTDELNNENELDDYEYDEDYLGSVDFSSFITNSNNKPDNAENNEITVTTTLAGNTKANLSYTLKDNTHRILKCRKAKRKPIGQKKIKNMFNSYDSMSSSKPSDFDEARLGKYQTLKDTSNEPPLPPQQLDQTKHKKKLLSVVYDVNKKKSSLTTSRNDSEDVELYDENIRLKTNPIHDIATSDRLKCLYEEMKNFKIDTSATKGDITDV